MYWTMAVNSALRAALSSLSTLGLPFISCFLRMTVQAIEKAGECARRGMGDCGMNGGGFGRKIAVLYYGSLAASGPSSSTILKLQHNQGVRRAARRPAVLHATGMPECV